MLADFFSLILVFFNNELIINIYKFKNLLLLSLKLLYRIEITSRLFLRLFLHSYIFANKIRYLY